MNRSKVQDGLGPNQNLRRDWIRRTKWTIKSERSRKDNMGPNEVNRKNDLFRVEKTGLIEKAKKVYD